jgi:hypothetical protein
MGNGGFDPTKNRERRTRAGDVLYRVYALRDEFCIGIKNSEREYLITQTETCAAAEIQSRQRRERQPLASFCTTLNLRSHTAERPNFDWKGRGIFSLLVETSFDHSGLGRLF